MDKDNRSVIETASATTSPDNANSGKFAYVIFGITCGVVLLLALAGAGIASVVLSIVAQEDLDSYDEALPDDIDGYDDFEQFLEQYYENPLTQKNDEKEQDKDRTSSEATVEDALDFDLAPYLDDLDARVPASSYANTPASVRDFVREIVSCDSEYASKIARTLDAAARDHESISEKLTEARGYCDEAKQALYALEVPTLDGVEDNSARDLLGSAKGEAAHRFELIADEIALLEEGDPVDTKSLWDRDDAVTESLDKAADLILEAMETVRTR